ncbi:MAG: lysylphosphatidylglycerol synthase transmembrane domain-containing protein [Bacillota bacterium]
MYRFLFALLMFFAVLFLASHYAESQKLLYILKRGNPFWVLAALVFETLFLFNRAGFYHAIYRVVGVTESWKRMVLLVSAGSFVGLVAPGGTFSGTALIVLDAVKRGATLARAVLVNVIYYLFDYGAFCVVLTAAFGYLWINNSLTAYEGMAAALLLVFVCAQVVILALAVRWPGRLVRLFGGAARFGRFVFPPLRRQKIDEKVATFLDGLVEAVEWLAKRPQGLLRVALHALLVEVLSVCILGAVFMAFAGRVPPGTLVAGYAVGVLFMIISITPSGIGVVEGAMAATLASLGVRSETAVLVTFVYRGITVWLPFLGGILSFRLVRRH